MNCIYNDFVCVCVYKYGKIFESILRSSATLRMVYDSKVDLVCTFEKFVEIIIVDS